MHNTALKTLRILIIVCTHFLSNRIGKGLRAFGISPARLRERSLSLSIRL
jgi:hypothetical protein